MRVVIFGLGFNVVFVVGVVVVGGGGGGEGERKLNSFSIDTPLFRRPPKPCISPQEAVLLLLLSLLLFLALIIEE